MFLTHSVSHYDSSCFSLYLCLSVCMSLSHVFKIMSFMLSLLPQFSLFLPHLSTHRHNQTVTHRRTHTCRATSCRELLARAVETHSLKKLGFLGLKKT